MPNKGRYIPEKKNFVSALANIQKDLKSHQELGQMEKGDKLRVVSVWGVPDLAFNLYRNPAFTRQFVVTLNTAIDIKDIRMVVKQAFEMGFKEET